MKNKKLIYCGLIGALAALIASFADVLLLYVPNGNYEKQDYTFFQYISDYRLFWGHYLGVLLIPLELFGFWHIYQAIKSTNKKYVLPVILTSVYVIIIGTVYHGMMGLAATIIKLKHEVNASNILINSNLADFIYYFEPIGILLFCLFAMLCLGLFGIIFFDKTHYPRWFAFVNPLFIYLIIVVIYQLFPSWGSALMVAGFNFSIFLLLSISTWILSKKQLTNIN